MKKLCVFSMLTMVIGALSGCGDPSSLGCTNELRSSVSVRVEDASGAPVNEATLTYSVDGGASKACDGSVCGWDEVGDFVITAEGAEGQMNTEEVTVQRASDGCHADSQHVTVVLPDAAS